MPIFRGTNSLKLFKICIFSFLVELIGLVIIGFCLFRVIINYKNLIMPSSQNLRFIHRISKLVSEEQSLSALYVLSTDDSMLREYELREIDIHNRLINDLSEFEKRLDDRDDLKQCFHDMNAICEHIFSQIDIAMTLRKNSSKALAETYISKDLLDSYSVVNDKLRILTVIIERDMDKAVHDMRNYTNVATIIITVAMAVLIITVLCLIFVCISLTEKLETNKEELQEEVERKTAEILKQNKHLKYLQEQTILGMANIIESRDSETGEHVKRTSRYVELLANAARDFGYYQEQLNAHYIEILKKVAPMHDIGKIAVSDTILQKPARLTTDEFEKIKIHTTEGEKIIREVLGKIESEEYVQVAIDVAKGHHEHWDGTGYPNHLKGEAIPLGARIMAIADVFDALISPRCYKKALSADAAFEIIRNSSGSHFDPILADLFLKMKDEVLKIMRM